MSRHSARGSGSTRWTRGARLSSRQLSTNVGLFTRYHDLQLRVSGLRTFQHLHSTVACEMRNTGASVMAHSGAAPRHSANGAGVFASARCTHRHRRAEHDGLFAQNSRLHRRLPAGRHRWISAARLQHDNRNLRRRLLLILRKVGRHGWLRIVQPLPLITVGDPRMRSELHPLLMRRSLRTRRRSRLPRRVVASV